MVDNLQAMPAFGFHLIPKDKSGPLPQLIANGTILESKTVRISVRLFYYLFDYLAWIPTNEGSIGDLVNRPPNWDSRGARVAHSILCSLASLFLLSPPTINLRGLYKFGSGTGAKGGKYDTIVCDRNELIALLNAMSNLMEEVIACDGYIYWSSLEGQRD